MYSFIGVFQGFRLHFRNTYLKENLLVAAFVYFKREFQNKYIFKTKKILPLGHPRKVAPRAWDPRPRTLHLGPGTQMWDPGPRTHGWDLGPRTRDL